MVRDRAISSTTATATMATPKPIGGSAAGRGGTPWSKFCGKLKIQKILNPKRGYPPGKACWLLVALGELSCSASRVVHSPTAVPITPPLPVTRPRCTSSTTSSTSFATTRWAHNELSTLCSRLTPEELAQRRACLFFRGINNTLAHIWLAEQLWLKRCRPAHLIHNPAGDSMDLDRVNTFWDQKHPAFGACETALVARSDASGGDVLDRIHTALLASADDWLEVCEALPDEFTGTALVTYKDSTEGNSKTAMLSQIMQHVVNHGTHHRGQVSAALHEVLPGQFPAMDASQFWFRSAVETPRASSASASPSHDALAPHPVR